MKKAVFWMLIPLLSFTSAICSARMNLAGGKLAEWGGGLSSLNPSFLVDSSMDTIWQTASQSSIGTHWVSIDFGLDTQFDTLILRTTRYSTAILGFAIDISDDAISWEEIFSYSEYPLPGADSMKQVPLPQSTARYMRFRVTDESAPVIGLAEIEVYNNFTTADSAFSFELEGVNKDVGIPAVIAEGAPFPRLLAVMNRTGIFSYKVYSSGDTLLYSSNPQEVGLLNEAIPVLPILWENYRVEARFQLDGETYIKNRYFSVYNAKKALPTQSQLVYEMDGKLRYQTDYMGNRIPDFSNCGYKGGDVQIPYIEAMIEIEPTEGDDGASIQAAVDYVSALPLEANGFRGAVLLKAGEYDVEGSIIVSESGVVIRGEGDDTIVRATGNTKRILFEFKGEAISKIADTEMEIIDPYVPVGSRTITVLDASGFSVGDKVIVSRAGNYEWINHIGMDNITPRPDAPEETVQWTPFNLDFDRVITAVTENTLTLDAPIVCAIEERWGGGIVYKYASGRISNSGLENIFAVSDFDDTVTAVYDHQTYFSDAEHAEGIARFIDAENCWVRNVRGKHFSQYHTVMGSGSKWITVKDCEMSEMVSVITGGNRSPYFISGQLCLVVKCLAGQGRHNFYVDSRVSGPNAFVDSIAYDEKASSEPHHRWSVGGLYDNVKAIIYVQDRQWMGSGHGWSGANYVLWNTEGEFIVQQPPTAQNWAVGAIGTFLPGTFEPRIPGYTDSLAQHVKIRSLYYRQLNERLGLPPEPEQPVNIAYKKTVEAGSQLSAARSTNAVDGDVSTTWQTSSASNKDTDHWLIVDLGEHSLFNRIVITSSANTKTVGGYRLEVSDDRENWRTIAEDETPLSSTAGEENTFDLPDINCRYLRYTSISSYSPSSGGFAEMSVYYSGNPPHRAIASYNGDKIRINNDAGVLVAAVFDEDNSLLRVATSENGELDLDIDFVPNGHYLKTFLWDGMNAMKPVEFMKY